MQSATSVLFACAAGTILLLCSCQKDLAIKQEQEIKSTALVNENNYCRIESVWENPGLSNERYRLILYDEYENPVAITTPVISSASSYRTFKYDQWHRLREFRSEFTRGIFEIWHFYGYDQSGLINVDTAYIFGDMNSGKPENYFERAIETIEYDNQNRIRRTTRTDSHGFTSSDQYDYDINGNLIEPGRVYDNNMNINRTNDIWMFINRDYSMNNSFVADEYNTSGFPTTINATHQLYIGFARTDINLSNSRISYSCRPASSGVY